MRTCQVLKLISKGPALPAFPTFCALIRHINCFYLSRSIQKKMSGELLMWNYFLLEKNHYFSYFLIKMMHSIKQSMAHAGPIALDREVKSDHFILVTCSYSRLITVGSTFGTTSVLPTKSLDFTSS